MGFSNERMRTGQLVNWFLLDGLELTPAGNPVTKALPLPFGVDHLIGFNELLTCKHPESAGVHFFLDDYQFERFWRQPWHGWRQCRWCGKGRCTGTGSAPDPGAAAAGTYQGQPGGPDADERSGCSGYRSGG